MYEIDVKQCIGVLSSACGTAIAVDLNGVLYTISLILTIAGTIWTFAIWPLIKWFRKAYQDKKITMDEIHEGLDILNDGIEKTKEELDKTKEK